jgi:prepilin-type N-terminal cleavage/methylation domain-containing protein
LRLGAGEEGRNSAARKRRGFTLVEVIVVLVILAILAAIAIPALTGYIAKAQDKEYISQARNISVAMKTVLNEAYASGKIDGNAIAKDEFTSGSALGAEGDKFVAFDIESISNALYHNTIECYKQAATLIGETYPVDTNSPGAWQYSPLASASSGATAATADGFLFAFMPEGPNEGSPAIAVTCKFKRLAEPGSDAMSFVTAFYENGVYDANAGYEVYKLTMPAPTP